MTIKKIISVGLCVLTLSASSVLPASAAKSADPKNEQIANKVEQFNNSRLAKLREYIWKPNYKFIKSGRVEVVNDLISLYRRLDNLVVSSTDVADSLCPSYNALHPLASNSIGGHIDLLVMFLGSIDAYGINQCLDCPLIPGGNLPVFSVKNEINILNYRLNQIETANK